MPDHKPMPVKGYTTQSESALAKVNLMKAKEEELLRLLDQMKDDLDIDQRWLAIGRTGIEQAFMAINRSVFKPNRIELEN